MWKYIFLCLLIIGSVMSQDQGLKLPVDPDIQERLSLALLKLSDELGSFRTQYENRVNLFRRVSVVEDYLQKVHQQVSQYDNVLVGQSNSISGSNNVILGSYNTISGSNNYAFIQKYTGRANGNLLLSKWRINLQNKNLILINPSSAISLINEEYNRKYLRYLTINNGVFGYGTNVGGSVVVLMKQNANDGGVFDEGKRVSYNPGGGGVSYGVNNDFQFGSSIKSIENSLILGQPVSSTFSNSQNENQELTVSASNQQSLSKTTLKLVQPSQNNQLGLTDSTFNVNVPLPSSSTNNIEPHIIAVRSTELLSGIQENMLSFKMATRYVPQPGSFIIPGPQITTVYTIKSYTLQPNAENYQISSNKKDDNTYQNPIFNSHPLNTNLRSQSLSINDSKKQVIDLIQK